MLLENPCKPLSGRPIIKQSILTSDIALPKGSHTLIGVKHMEHQRNRGW